MQGPAVEFQNVSMSFGPVRALENVSFAVRAGGVHALLGANGAGKSTLLKILCGVYPAGGYGGAVLVNGRPAAFRAPHDALRQGIGYVPQEITVIEALTVAENIFVGRTGIDGTGVLVAHGELRARAARLLAEHRIDLNPAALVDTLSASQRQLVMIARALATRPAVLILDEATACLTDRETENLFALVRSFTKQHLTTMFVTHRLREVEQLADRVTVLRDGRLAAEFARDEIRHERMVTAMVGKTLEAEKPRGASAAPVVLRVENLCVPHPRLARRNVVEQVSFELRRGEILGLGGVVGAGRTEVLSALYGRVPHQGHIEVEDRPVRIRSPRQAATLGIGLLTEERKKDGLLFNLPLFKNMTLGALGRAAQHGLLTGGRERAFVGGLFRQLAIRAPSVNVMPATLSGGNQQKVILARLLLAEPRVLLLDEPTKGVDVGAKAEIYRLLFDLAARGIGILVVSSELPELLTLCDRILVLSRGRMTDQMTRSEASEQRIMLAATGHTRQEALV